MGTEETRQKIAMARFAIIAPVINGTHIERSASAYYRRIAQTPFVLPCGSHQSYSPRTYEDWVRKYKNQGFEGLLPKMRSDKGNTRKLSGDAISAIYVLKNRFPKINATIMYEKMIEDGVIDAHEISLSSVQRFVKRNLISLSANPQGKDRRSFEMARVCELWQADSLYGPYLKSPPQRAYLQTIIDDKSRLIVAAKFYLADSAINFQATLRSAICTYGIPESAYFDNGAPYKNTQLALICAHLGIVLMHTPVRDGAAKGKVERWNRNCRSRFINLLEQKDLVSLEALNDQLASWVQTYNTTVHSSIRARPIDVFAKEAHLIRKPRSESWLFDCFLNRIERKVSKDAVVRIGGIDFDCPWAYIGIKTQFRYDPLDLSRVWIHDSEKRIECFPTDRVANSKTKRIKPVYELDYTRKEERNV